MILVDAHVHIYDCFDIGKFLDAAYLNFRAEANRLGLGNKLMPILLLAETAKYDWFARFREYVGGNCTNKDRALKKWEFHYTDERVSLTARSENFGDLFIIAGRQVETLEGLEVLALSTLRRFNSDIPIIDLIKEIKKHDEIPVIPWGFGKWLGRRGKILDNLIETCKDLKIFLGDNGGRPPFLPIPHHFEIAKRYGIHILPGSDPLPFTTEYNRVGSFGFLLEENVSETKPAESLNHILMTPEIKLQAFGSFENPFRFFRNQLKMQVKKQYSKYKA